MLSTSVCLGVLKEFQCIFISSSTKKQRAKGGRQKRKEEKLQLIQSSAITYICLITRIICMECFNDQYKFVFHPFWILNFIKSLILRNIFTRMNFLLKIVLKFYSNFSVILPWLLYDSRDKRSKPLRGSLRSLLVPTNESLRELSMPNDKFCTCIVPTSIFLLKNSKSAIKSLLPHHLMISCLPSRGKLSKGSFLSTSMPSPPPVSFFDTSATE